MSKKRRPPLTKADAVRLSKNRIASALGKEDSYERNPSGVSFVFNHRIFRTFMKVLKMLFSLSKRIFDKLTAGPFRGPAVSLSKTGIISVYLFIFSFTAAPRFLPYRHRATT